MNGSLQDEVQPRKYHGPTHSTAADRVYQLITSYCVDEVFGLMCWKMAKNPTFFQMSTTEKYFVYYHVRQIKYANIHS